MFKCAFWLFRLHWSKILLVSTTLFAADLYSAGRISTALVPSLLGYGYLAYIFHASLLEDFHQKTWGSDATMQQDWRFWIAYLFPFVTLLGAALGIAFLIHSILPSGKLTLDVILSVSLLISLTISLFLLSVFGTMIPAAIAKKSVGFKAALKRSHGSYWFVFWRLLVGPAFMGIVWVSLGTFLTLTELVPQIPETFSEVTVTNAFWSIAVKFLGSFLSALCASIFSLAYLRAEVGSVSLVSGGLQKV